MYRLRQEVMAAMQSHAEACAPNECCGLLGGNQKLFSDYYPLTNRAELPKSQYFAAPEEIFQMMQRMRLAGQDQLGIFHSHPYSAAYPSAKDIELAFYPEAINFILSLSPAPKLCAFQINQKTVTTVDFIIVD